MSDIRVTSKVFINKGNKSVSGVPHTLTVNFTATEATRAAEAFPLSTVTHTELALPVTRTVGLVTVQNLDDTHWIEIGSVTLDHDYGDYVPMLYLPPASSYSIYMADNKAPAARAVSGEPILDYEVWPR